MTEPKRLLDDPTTDEALRRALDGARSHVPPLDTARGLARLEQAATPASALLGPAALGVLALALAAGVGAMLWTASERDESEPRREEDREIAVSLAEEPTPSEAPESAPPSGDEPTERAPTAPEEELLPAAPPAPPTGSRPRETHATTPAEEPSASDRAALEIRLLGEARRVVATDPGGALALLRQLDREVGTGFLGVEREGLTVLALAGTGARAEAARRGERFLSQHPDGALAERVRRAIRASE